MAEIIPAILSHDFKEIKEKLLAIDGLTNWVQLDILDGLFTPRLTSWENFDDLRELGGKAKLEAHLMVEHPEDYLPDWRAAVDRIIVHYEATEKLDEILSTLEPTAIEVGVALLLATPLEVLEKYIAKLDVVQLMGIAEIGQQGQTLDPQVIERVRTLRQRHPGVTIEVDGGVTLENAPDLIAAGGNNLVVGSAIWQSQDAAKTIASFKKLFS